MRANRRQLLPGERIRVLIVDDSVVIRRLLVRSLSDHPLIEVVDTAANGVLALERAAQLAPDVITLDIEMPEMTGIEVLRHLRSTRTAVRVVMFSTLTERGASMTLEALALGADDYVTKSTAAFSDASPVTAIQQLLIPKILQFFRAPGEESEQMTVPAPAKPIVAPLQPHQAIFSSPKAVLIGTSTGGPTALSEILPQFPEDFPWPVLIVQHMPPLFTRLLAERLNSNCSLQVAEASQGTSVSKGRVLIAPGDYHMKLAKMNGQIGIELDQSPPQNYCRPAVDVLFHSAADVYGGAVIAVILTGMGHDGCRGAGILKANGARILAQDEASSVVWGMPGAVANAGIADRVLALNEIVPELTRIARRSESSI